MPFVDPARAITQPPSAPSVPAPATDVPKSETPVEPKPPENKSDR
jgi:hypothetical protein